MEFHHRKLFSESDNTTEDCGWYCDSELNVSSNCPSSCCSVCPAVCSSIPSRKPHKPSPYLALSLSVLATTFFVVCLYVFYKKCYSRRRLSRRRNSQAQAEGAHDDFIDEDQEPVVDHPIWYIRTVGLQPSVISAITICKYKRGDGLVEGTECSVCLTEFEEDESVRLLPKCNHAFHIPCIDTWLSSHTNCPMCRAGIVSSTAGAPSPEQSVENSGPLEEARVEIPENSGQFEEIEDEVCELRIGREEEGELEEVENERNGCEVAKEEVDEIQPMRRSVSMDSLSASMISLALANVHPQKSNGNSDSQLAKSKKSIMPIVPKRVGGNQSRSASTVITLTIMKGYPCVNSPTSTYFSALKRLWLMENLDVVKKAVEGGDIVRNNRHLVDLE
ncbi:hypothetical protein PVL29_003731 [Vitis rotundifolia]|uniref:RING-type E3 ubiquitin transferase n=1 Tax=Vitis rotundifolia TaxID=103349 RepID=A0AA39ADS6_VITRO|nr:hypothetical protein PVL29_003731 [Vitis rotundifolia]